MKKQLLLLVMMLSTAVNVFAAEVEINGLWYEVVSKTKEAKVIANKNSIKYSGNIVIPETVEYEGTTYHVKSISTYAFYDCQGLYSITISNGVTNIESYAFYDCKRLTSVTIPQSVTSIGDNAFAFCI